MYQKVACSYPNVRNPAQDVWCCAPDIQSPVAHDYAIISSWLQRDGKGSMRHWPCHSSADVLKETPVQPPNSNAVGVTSQGGFERD